MLLFPRTLYLNYLLANLLLIVSGNGHAWELGIDDFVKRRYWHCL